MLGQDHFLPQRFGETPDGEFRRVVGRLARHREDAEHTGNIDDVAVAGGDQVGQESLRAVDHAPVVDIHDSLDVLERRDLHVAAVRDAGVVVDLVHLAELIFDLIGIQGQCLAFGDVETVRPHRRAKRLEAPFGDCQAFGIDVADRHGGTGSAQFNGEGLADTRARSGHNRHFASESLHAFPLLTGVESAQGSKRVHPFVTPAQPPTMSST